jgi:hypothetical protein
MHIPVNSQFRRLPEDVQNWSNHVQKVAYTCITANAWLFTSVVYFSWGVQITRINSFRVVHAMYNDSNASRQYVLFLIQPYIVR